MAVTFQLIMSLDGYVAGPDQSVEDPLGVGMTRAFAWFFELEVWRRVQGIQGGEVNESTAVIEEARANVGAYVMGRNMFGGGHGPWPDGTRSALDEAQQAAGDRDVRIAGGADTVRQYLREGLVDEFELSVAPVLLGDGERLFENVGDVRLEQVRAVAAPGVTHLRYRIGR
jgi:hypothetical protein